jgi:hypothetical protein
MCGRKKMKKLQEKEKSRRMKKKRRSMHPCPVPPCSSIKGEFPHSP